MDFTAIDFETANGFRGSPCAVGLSKVRGGVVVEEASWLMRPPANHDAFDHHNVRIHGIRPEQVAGLPRFGELFPEIGAFIGDDVLAAHNAAFDLGVIRSGLEVSGLPGPAYDYVCTVMLSRRCYSLVSNSLPYAAAEAGVPLLNHHDAAEDARACAGILIDIAARNGAASIAELYLSLGLAVSRQPAFDPRRDPLSKATQSALAANHELFMGFRTNAGEAMAMGERTPLALLSGPASGRMAVAEALTNIVAADVRAIGDVKLSANWMAACGDEAEDAERIAHGLEEGHHQVGLGRQVVREAALHPTQEQLQNAQI